jgi:hypothetical protein
MDTSKANLEVALSAFTKFDGEAAIEYGKLFELTRPLLAHYLRLRFGRKPDHDDLLQIAFIKVWEQRTRLSFDTSAQWLFYLKRVIDRLIIDGSRRVGGATSVSIDDLAEPPCATEAFVLQIANAMESDSILRSADKLWLGSVAGSFAPRLIVAKLLISDHKPWEQVLQVARQLAPNIMFDSEASIRSWALNPSVVRAMAFQLLCPSPQAVTAMVIGCCSEDVPVLAQCARGKMDSGNPDLELCLIMSKFYFLEPTSVALRQPAQLLNESTAREILDRCLSKLPFVNVMESLWRDIGDTSVRNEALSKPGLWKRLVSLLGIGLTPQ